MTAEHGSSPHGTEPTSSDAAESSPASPESARPNGPASVKRLIRRCSASWQLVIAATMVACAVGVPAALFFAVYRPDQQVGDAAAQRAVQVASDGAVAVLSYAPDNLNRDFAKAESYLTGNFLAYYIKFTEQIAALAQQKRVTQSAKVIRAAISELHADSAAVLVFIDQTATSKDKPQPQTTATGAMVTLTKVKNSWLISKLDPLS
ncbi:hypothetical protein [Mycobacterium parmense]|uniref:Uncharacterized protein n=1 Tax=Mycobacterium parmense TaxID=185642 RepID=A0A7I7Z0V1_9MYCO|nr:hypothetical protein [Mycobacterium parmense]MCV7352493.1 hypothetical protein [Mycobacterium parmense]ORW55771.1 hypothetical protein AWC20_17540 [Mycobacterium parmense]BBZ47785.1 hypothetical protein MPRM_50660 [Mycobacterium parmense]